MTNQKVEFKEERTINLGDYMNVGIVSIECYIPLQYVCQNDMELYDQNEYKNECNSNNDMIYNDMIYNKYIGKYTKGLGQKEMSFVSDCEDIYSISLTVLNNLINKNNININDIGRLSVASETILDHSKSIKSYLMQLFKGNNDIINDVEGCDSIHACYSSTSQLFDAFYWATNPIYNKSGKYAVVVCADIAEYAKGPARPTGGACAIAMLIGKNGCIKLSDIKSTDAKHVYDFYKPHLSSPYPEVNGNLTRTSYITSIDACYNGFINKWNKKHDIKMKLKDNNDNNDNNELMNTDLYDNNDYGSCIDYSNGFRAFKSINHWIFHSPYNKIVQKALARIFQNDYDRFKNIDNEYKDIKLNKISNLDKNGKILKDVDYLNIISKCYRTFSQKYYKQYTEPSTYLSTRIGNSYTSSLFVSLLSLLYSYQGKEEQLLNTNIGCFAYGSGKMASMYCLHINNNKDNIKSIKEIIKNNDIKNILNTRIKRSAKYFVDTLDVRLKMTHGNHNSGNNTPIKALNGIKNGIKNDTFYKPINIPKDSVRIGTYYLDRIDTKKRRYYKIYTK